MLMHQDPSENNIHFRPSPLMEFPKLPKHISYEETHGPIEIQVVQLLPDFDGNFDDDFDFDDDVSYNEKEYRKLSNSFKTDEISFIDDFMQDPALLPSLGIAPRLVQRIRSDSLGKSDYKKHRDLQDEQFGSDSESSSHVHLLGRSSPRLSLSEDGFIILRNYKISPDTLGGGKLSEVRLAYGEKDHQQYAVKIHSKTKLENANLLLRTSRNPLEEVRREIEILKRLTGHPNIIKLIDVIDEDNDNIYLIFERLDRELMTIPSDKPYHENEVRKYFLDILNGVEFMHSHRIAHRDLKPENMLLNRDGSVKIADFGFCDELTPSTEKGMELVTSNSQAGTPAFFAPECLSACSKQLSGKALDMWSLGITLYSLVFGDVPFKGESMPQLFNAILNDEIRFPENIRISSSLRSLISHLLAKEPAKRCRMEEVRNHPWLNENLKEPKCIDVQSN